MPKEKKKGILILLDIIMGISIVVIVAALIFLFISTESRFKSSGSTVARPEVPSEAQVSPWEKSYEYEDIVLSGNATVSVAAEQNEDYIFPESNSRKLDENEIKALSQEEMRLARNEIYARHGRIFNDEALKEYFSQKPWYTPTLSADDMDAMGDEIFNEYEYYNKNLIAEIEEELGYR